LRLDGFGARSEKRSSAVEYVLTRCAVTHPRPNTVACLLS
jgi:hypothetical protein